MIDLHAHFGRCRKAVGYDELMRVMEADKVEVDEATWSASTPLGRRDHGDAARRRHEQAGRRLYRPGRARDNCCSEVTDSGAAALISDNYAVELLPARAGSGAQHAFMPLHEHCLFKLGVHLGEIWYSDRTRAVAARQRAQPFPAHRAAAQAARRGRLPGDAGGYGIRVPSPACGSGSSNTNQRTSPS